MVNISYGTAGPDMHSCKAREIILQQRKNNTAILVPSQYGSVPTGIRSGRQVAVTRHQSFQNPHN